MCGRKFGTTRALREPTKLTLKFTEKRAETPITRKLKFMFLFGEINRLRDLKLILNLSIASDETAAGRDRARATG